MCSIAGCQYPGDNIGICNCGNQFCERHWNEHVTFDSNWNRIDCYSNVPTANTQEVAQQILSSIDTPSSNHTIILHDPNGTVILNELLISFPLDHALSINSDDIDSGNDSNYQPSTPTNSTVSTSSFQYEG